MSKIERPKGTLKGLRHIALNTYKMKECVDFYTRLLGMNIDWQPDDDNYYLVSKDDSLALHRTYQPISPNSTQRLDHIGFFLSSPQQVDRWHNYLERQQVPILAAPKTHRDGCRSFYCQDPDGNTLQFLFYP